MLDRQKKSLSIKITDHEKVWRLYAYKRETGISKKQRNNITLCPSEKIRISEEIPNSCYVNKLVEERLRYLLHKGKLRWLESDFQIFEQMACAR